MSACLRLFSPYSSTHKIATSYSPEILATFFHNTERLIQEESLLSSGCLLNYFLFLKIEAVFASEKL
jgi:hypothetical protein